MGKSYANRQDVFLWTWSMLVNIALKLSQPLVIALYVFMALPVAVAGADQTPVPPDQPLIGTLEIVWGDRLEGDQLQETTTEVTLRQSDGTVIPLDLDAAISAPLGGLEMLQGQDVAVRLDESTVQSAKASVTEVRLTEPVFTAQTMRDPLRGSRSWIFLLCKGQGSYIEHENPVRYYTNMLLDPAEGQDHYWRELSYGAINLLGSGAAGWFDLPSPAAAYAIPYRGGYKLDIEKVNQDCTKAAAADVDFTAFEGIAFFVPLPREYLEDAIWFMGGGSVLDLDGEKRFFRTVWMPKEIVRSGHPSVSLLSHEMGHGFGLPHSSGPYGNVYDSGWDVMSNDSHHCGGELDSSPYGCPAQHTIAFHKDLLGWIAAAQKYVAPAAFAATIMMERLALPTRSAYLFSQVPIGDSTTHFYSVEARRYAGYDRYIPGEAVIIHDVDLKRTSGQVAQVIDADHDGDPNDDGAMWLPGETFTGEGGVTICVEGKTPTGFIVGIGRGKSPTCNFEADLADSRTSVSEIFPSVGQTVTLRLELVNYRTPAQGLVVTSTIPAGTTYVSGTAVTSRGTVSFTADAELVFEVGELTYDSSVEIEFSVVVNAETSAPTVLYSTSSAVWTEGSHTLMHRLIANSKRVYLPIVTR